MTHLPYIIAAYGITFFCILVISLQANLRLKKAQKKLMEIKNLQS